MAVNNDGATHGANEPADHSECRSLPGTIRAKQPCDLAIRADETYAVDSLDVTVVLDEVPHFDQAISPLPSDWGTCKMPLDFPHTTLTVKHGNMSSPKYIT